MQFHHHHPVVEIERSSSATTKVFGALPLVVLTLVVLSAFLFFSLVPLDAEAKSQSKKKPKAYTIEYVSVYKKNASDVEKRKKRKTFAVQRAVNPKMQVLIGDALEPTQLTVDGDFIVENEVGRVLFAGLEGEEVKIRYSNGEYVVRYHGMKKNSKTPVKVTPLQIRKVVEVMNYENRPTWNPELNDNIFFGSIQVVYSEMSQKVLLVNDIPLERYVRGIAEVSDSFPKAHLRTILTAARTYALFHITHPTKHAGQPYILDATVGDQVYRGAGFSQRSPNVVQAQYDTKKKVILYNDEPIIAAYFSRSDGRTRAWSEVWSGSYGWSESVEDPCCTGEILLGHGVGMSGAGSRYFAEQGWGWKEIIQYYYQDIEIQSGY